MLRLSIQRIEKCVAHEFINLSKLVYHFHSFKMTVSYLSVNQQKLLNIDLSDKCVKKDTFV